MLNKKKNCLLPTYWSIFKLYLFKEKKYNFFHIVLFLGNLKNKIPILIRIHSECLTGDILFSQKCECGNQLKNIFKKISKNKRGIIIYLKQEGRGVGLKNKINIYLIQDYGLNTLESNLKKNFLSEIRNYKFIIKILFFFNIKNIRLITNNPNKIIFFKKYLNVVENIILIKNINFFNENYFLIKMKIFKHLIKY